MYKFSSLHRSRHWTLRTASNMLSGVRCEVLCLSPLLELSSSKSPSFLPHQTESLHAMRSDRECSIPPDCSHPPLHRCKEIHNYPDCGIYWGDLTSPCRPSSIPSLVVEAGRWCRTSQTSCSQWSLSRNRCRPRSWQIETSRECPPGKYQQVSSSLQPDALPDLPQAWAVAGAVPGVEINIWGGISTLLTTVR